MSRHASFLEDEFVFKEREHKLIEFEESRGPQSNIEVEKLSIGGDNNSVGALEESYGGSMSLGGHLPNSGSILENTSQMRSAPTQSLETSMDTVLPSHQDTIMDDVPEQSQDIGQSDIREPHHDQNTQPEQPHEVVLRRSERRNAQPQEIVLRKSTRKRGPKERLNLLLEDREDDNVDIPDGDDPKTYT